INVMSYMETKRVTMREGGGYGERGKACESGRLQADVGAEVQSSEWHPQDADERNTCPGFRVTCRTAEIQWHAEDAIPRIELRLLHQPAVDHFRMPVLF